MKDEMEKYLKVKKIKTGYVQATEWEEITTYRNHRKETKDRKKRKEEI